MSWDHLGLSMKPEVSKTAVSVFQTWVNRSTADASPSLMLSACRACQFERAGVVSGGLDGSVHGRLGKSKTPSRATVDGHL